MPSTRLSLLQESLLWDIALEHFGAEGLLQVIVELWSAAGPPPRTTVDHLSTATLSHEVLNILKVAQVRVDAFVPGRRPTLGTITLYSRHASALADGLLTRLPKKRLSRTLRGSRLEIEVGL